MSGDRLDGVRRVREIQERVARGNVARARATAARSRSAEEEVRRQFELVGASLGTAAGVETFLVAQQNLQACISVARVRHEVAQADETVVGDELQAWGGAAQRLEATERLAERARGRAADKERHDEINHIDDVAVMRHRNRVQR